MRIAAMLLALAPALLLGTAAPAQTAKPAPVRWVEVVARTAQGGTRQGNPGAPIKLVEYGSRSCPTCGRFANEGVAELRAKYIATGKVSYEYREFWVHPQDPGLSLLGQCVPLSRFFPLLDAMYAGQDAFNERVTQQLYDRISKLPTYDRPLEWVRALGYADFIKQRGLTEARLIQCMSRPAQDALVKRINEAVNAGVQGTPSFFINGQMLGNVYSWPQLEQELHARGA